MSTEFMDALYEWLETPVLEEQGMDAPLDEAIAEAKERFPFRNICVVKSWCRIDLAASPWVLEDLAARGQLPALLVASQIIHDSLKRFSSGKGIRTSFLAVEVDGPFFITLNTVYVLLGSGCRRRMQYTSFCHLF